MCPEQLDPALLPGAPFRRACEVDMLGHHPDVSAVDGDRVRQASVLPPDDGGGVDAGLASLRRELAIALDVPAVSQRVRKVVSAGADEAHLFLALDVTALPFRRSTGSPLRMRFRPSHRLCRMV